MRLFISCLKGEKNPRAKRLVSVPRVVLRKTKHLLQLPLIIFIEPRIDGVRLKKADFFFSKFQIAYLIINIIIPLI